MIKSITAEWINYTKGVLLQYAIVIIWKYCRCFRRCVTGSFAEVLINSKHLIFVLIRLRKAKGIEFIGMQFQTKRNQQRMVFLNIYLSFENRDW